MKSVFITAVLLLTFTTHYGQNIQNLEARLEGANDTARVNVLNQLASLYFVSDPSKTKIYSEQARQLADSLQYVRGQAEALFNESLLFRLKEQNTKQLELLLSALGLFRTIQDSANITRTMAEIGLAYHQQGDFAAARNYYNLALDLYKKMGDVKGEAFTLRRIGTMAVENRKYDEAEQLFLEVLRLEKSIQNTDGLGNILNNLGVLYFELGNYEKALTFHREAMEELKKANNLNRLPASYHNHGRTYLAMGKIKDAEDMALKALPLAQQLDNRMAMVEAAELLYDIHKVKKDYAKALHYLELRNTVRDSIINSTSSVHFARLKALAETEQKEKEISLLKLEQEHARFRQLVLFGFLSVVVVAALLIIFYLRQSLAAKKMALQKSTEAFNAHTELTRIEFENKKLHEEELKRDLEYRQRELVTYTLHMVQKNTLMEGLREGIRELLGTTDPAQKMKLTKLIKLIDYSLETEKDWAEFKMYFEKVHHSFFNNLKAKFPDLTQSDLKLCALISLNLTMKEMAELMGISPESVKMARHRLRKKLDIATEENLADFIGSFKTT